MTYDYGLTEQDVAAIEQAIVNALNRMLAELKGNPVIQKVPPSAVFCICGGRLLELAKMHGAATTDLQAALGGALIGLSMLDKTKH